MLILAHEHDKWSNIMIQNYLGHVAGGAVYLLLHNTRYRMQATVI